MDKIVSGNGRTHVLIKALTITINGSEYYVKNAMTFPVEVLYYYEPFLEALEDDPGCEEFFQLNSVRVKETTKFVNMNGLELFIDRRMELTNLLTEDQLDQLVIELKKQSKGYLNSPPEVKYTDNDLLRPPVRKDVKRQLGHYLVQPYDDGDRNV